MQYKNAFVILLASGSGKRLAAKTKKQFVLLGEAPLFLWSLQTFLSNQELNKLNTKIILVISPGDYDTFTSLIYSHINKESLESNRLFIVEGSSISRNMSVYNGLKHIQNQNPNSIVLIHDSARPFINHNDISNLLKALYQYPSVTLACPLTDTIKKLKHNNRLIKKHLDRKHHVRILTPQGFHFDIITKAYLEYAKKPYPATDDTIIVQAIGQDTSIIIGSKTNLKITTKEDLAFANYMIKQNYLS